MRFLGLVLIWAITATVAGVALWVPLGGVCHALTGPLGAAGIVPAWLLLLVYAPYVGLQAFVCGLPVLAILFGVWALLCARRPALDCPGAVSLYALLIALPGSCLLAATWLLRDSAGFSWSRFVWIVPFYCVILWAAIVSPRRLVSTLAFGSFSESTDIRGRAGFGWLG